jgi:hypothetical protein
LVGAGWEFFGNCAWDYDRAFGYAPSVFYGFWPRNVDDFGGHGEYNVGTEYDFFFEVHAFYDDAARADEAAVFDYYGGGLYGFEYAADAYAATEVYVFADLCAAAYGGPGVDHGAAIYVAANVYVGGHEDYAGG